MITTLATSQNWPLKKKKINCPVGDCATASLARLFFLIRILWGSQSSKHAENNLTKIWLQNRYFKNYLIKTGTILLYSWLLTRNLTLKKYGDLEFGYGDSWKFLLFRSKSYIYLAGPNFGKNSPINKKNHWDSLVWLFSDWQRKKATSAAPSLTPLKSLSLSLSLCAHDVFSN